MVKKANLNEEFFIVLTFKHQDLSPILEIQQLISEHYQLYKDNQYPELHITIDRIKRKEAKNGIEIIKNIAKKTGIFSILINNFKCLKANNNFLTLKVNSSPKLIKLANNIHQTLEKKDLSTIDNYKEWNFHMTLINNYFSNNPIPDSEFTELCTRLDGLKHTVKLPIKALEIWKPTLDPAEKVVASFKL